MRINMRKVFLFTALTLIAGIVIAGIILFFSNPFTKVLGIKHGITSVISIALGSIPFVWPLIVWWKKRLTRVLGLSQA